MTSHNCNKEGEIATMAEQIRNIEKKVDTIDIKLDNLPERMKEVFVSKVEFEKRISDLLLLKKIVFGAIGLILTAFLLYIISLAFKG
jgi:hypothetical protein